jgi:hypothetical protein
MHHENHLTNLLVNARTKALVCFTLVIDIEFFIFCNYADFNLIKITLQIAL